MAGGGAHHIQPKTTLMYLMQDMRDEADRPGGVWTISREFGGGGTSDQARRLLPQANVNLKTEVSGAVGFPHPTAAPATARLGSEFVQHLSGTSRLLGHATTSTTTTATMPQEVKQRSGIATGLNAGHPKPRVSRMKGHLSKRTAFVRDVVKEVSGLAPYERRVIELLRNSKDKRARKLAKKRLGTFGRGKRKVDEMTKVIAESRRAGH
ncbi:hypothetical protein D0863_03770 [Hortaea werneckii]|uniref:60S ribosomal protein L36 n=1 Tax=Hortaea werneckii TaxID=91943 RepID=A0A3M7EC11_HORWE|nr:hypothetical protein D0863_03770 [Hortaea werneckii]